MDDDLFSSTDSSNSHLRHLSSKLIYNTNTYIDSLKLQGSSLFTPTDRYRYYQAENCGQRIDTIHILNLHTYEKWK